LADEHPNSKFKQIMEKMNLNATHACVLPKLKKIPLPKPLARPRRIAEPARQIARRPAIMRQLHNIPPLRRSERLRRGQQQR
jgi:hypothetical protein